MGKVVDDTVSLATFGQVKDVTGQKAAGKAGERAAEAQVTASQAGIAEQRRQFDISQEQAAPFREAGIAALGQQQALLGLSGQEAQQQAFQGLTESPGQQFIRQRQEKALLRNAAATGGLGGGNVLSALNQQQAGFAQQDIQNQFARLGQLSGQGQATTSQIAKLGGQTASNIAGLQGQAGAARASGILAPTQAATAATNQVLQLAGAGAGAYAAGA
jgi:hypothetical protein